MLFSAVKSKFAWSTSNSESRRHTFKEKTEPLAKTENDFGSKRCMSMPSVVSSSPTASSSTTFSSSYTRSRMLRLQDKRFHQKFQKVDPDEHLLNYFSCALLQDRLLHQGHLFITDNFFAFYSNIFGHKKQILIPISDVVKVTKEKTARIIPNAVGVYTDKDKFIFGSLLSRDTAFRVIQQTWIHSTDAGVGLHEDSECEISPVLVLMCPGEEDSSVSSGLSGQLTSDDVSLGMTSDASPLVNKRQEMTSTTGSCCSSTSHPQTTPLPDKVTISKNITKECLFKVEELVTYLYELPRMTLLYVISLALIVLLLLSAGVLFYRISLVHQRLPSADNWYLDTMARYNQASTVIGRDVEIEMVLRKVQERVRHITLIRHAIDELLLTTTELYPIQEGPAD